MKLTDFATEPTITTPTPPSSFFTEQPFTLRPYQQDALTRFLEAKKGIVVLPTGTGKTLVAMKAMALLQVATAIIVPTEPLLHQWRKWLRRYGVACTAFYGKEKQLGQVTIFIINSAVEHMDQLKGYSFLVFDEVHHLGAEQFSRLLKMDAPYMLGLTATVKRLDEAHHTIMRVMPIIYQMSVGDARKNGYMSRMEVRDIRVEMSAEFRMEYDKLSRRIMNLFRDLPHYTNLFRLKGNPKAQEAIQLISRRRLLLANIPEKIFKVKQVIDENPTEKILLFSETIRSIQAIQQYLNSQSIQTGVYHSHMKHADREEALSSWREGKFPILLSVRCLEEGIDVPECNVGVFYASGSSDRQLIQRLGRILRPQPGKTAKLYVIFCPRTTEQRHAWRIRNL